MSDAVRREEDPQAAPAVSLQVVLVSRRRQQAIARAAAYVVLTLAGACVLVPLFWMISSALKSEYEVFAWPPQWIPAVIQWANFPDALTALPFATYFVNTLTVTIVSVGGTLLSSTMVAYGFARFRAPGRQFWFLVMVSTMMLPYAVFMIPQFVLFNKLHWVNSLRPLIVPAFFGNPFYIFLLRQFFLSVPTDMEEAAKIDGANALQALYHVLLPLARPALAAVAIFQFLGAWNDFLGPLIFLNDQRLYTLALGINFFKSQHLVQWNLLMAASLVVMLPCVALFFAAQRYFIEGITLTGVKG